MHTVQHPFFLSSAKGSNRSTDGSTFTVKLDRPLKIPREALHTRVYCNQASAICAFPNVSAALTATFQFICLHFCEEENASSRREMRCATLALACAVSTKTLGPTARTKVASGEP